MGGYLQPNVFIPLIVGILAVVLYFIFTKINQRYPRKRPKGKDEEEGESIEPIYEPIEARVADNILGRIYNTTISAKDVKKIIEKYGTLGRRWNREGKQVYGMVKLEDGDYKPIIPPKQISSAPSELHDDMKQPEVEVLMDMREEKSFFGKYGQLLWWTAVMAFIIFMMTQGH